MSRFFRGSASAAQAARSTAQKERPPLGTGGAGASAGTPPTPGPGNASGSGRPPGTASAAGGARAPAGQKPASGKPSGGATDKKSETPPRPKIKMSLTTNGMLLAQQAQALHEAGLRRITVSLDALDPQVFADMSGRRGRVEDVLAGVDAAVAAGFRRLKINAVVQGGVNEDQVLPLVERFRGTGHVVRFIEFMDVGDSNDWRRDRMVPSSVLWA